VIHGVGIDIVRVERIKEAVGKWGEKFLGRVFTGKEISRCYEKKDPFPSLAVRFAAKEALIKAVGSRLSAFTDIEILNDSHGKPFVRTSGKLEVFFRESSLRASQVSLSHEREYAIAFVVIERS